MRVARGSPHDREIVRLAVPALGALAAEPLYLLADTAIVGHLGTRPLAGLAVAGSVLTAAFTVFNFLAYSTTAAVARHVGAGNRKDAAETGVDGCWLAVGLGLTLTVLGLVLAPAITDVMGASANVGRTCARSNIILPSAIRSSAEQGSPLHFPQSNRA